MKTIKTWKNFEKPWEITWKKRKRTLKYHENHESPWKPKKRLLKTRNTMKTPWTRSSSLFSWSASSAPIQEQLWPTEVLTEVNSTGAFACIQFYFDWWRVGELSCDRCSAAGNCAVLYIGVWVLLVTHQPRSGDRGTPTTTSAPDFIVYGLIHQTFEWLTLKHVRFEFHILYTHYATLTELHLSIGHLSIEYIIYP